MTEYREILRLHSMGISQRNIAYSCHASKPQSAEFSRKPRSWVLSGRLMKTRPIASWQSCFPLLRASPKTPAPNLTSHMFVRNL